MRVLYYRDCRALNRVEFAVVTAKGVEISEPVELETKWYFINEKKKKQKQIAFLAYFFIGILNNLSNQAFNNFIIQLFKNPEFEKALVACKLLLTIESFGL